MVRVGHSTGEDIVKRALTGIQPSGTIHLGNYLGAIRPALELQEQFQAFYFIADYHALTTVTDPEVLRRTTREIAATYLALGLDPERTCLFRQSHVTEVLELSWILACNWPAGLLERGHAVKAARDAGRAINAGTVFYPVLMASDILLYDADVVPVGADQKQHVEMARDAAVRINHHFGDGTLVVPDVSIREGVGVVPGLDGRKMSKSYDNAIGLWLPPKQLRKAVMRIVTDSLGVDDAKDPDRCNVFGLYRLFADPAQTADLAERYRAGGLGYGHAKQELFELIDRQVAEARDRYHGWLQDPSALDDVLAAGADRARLAARATLDRVRERVGLD